MAFGKVRQEKAEKQVLVKPEQVLIRKDRVEQKKKEGFRVVGTGKDSRGKILGVRTHADDLVLMEK